MKLKSLPKVRICVTMTSDGHAMTRIFGATHHAPIFRENINARESMRGEVLLRDAIKEFGLSLDEIKFLR